MSITGPREAGSPFEPMMRNASLLLLLAVSVCLAQSPIPPGAKLERVATGFLQAEGPVWYDGPGLKSAADSSVLFSDIAGNKIYQYSPSTGKCIPFLNPSDSSNGMTFDREGNLVFCQMGLRRVVRMNSDGTIIPLAATFRGKKFNSPNDVVVKSDGAIFFTDPPFNIPAGEKQELPFSGIFRISPTGAVQLLDSTLSLPNGICFSPDESRLYVNDSHACLIYEWDVVDDSLLENKRLFATIKASGYADGMKVDSAGNLFSAGPLGVWVFDKNGSCLDTILVPGSTSNLNWGDPDGKSLYITTQTSLYRIRLGTVTGTKSEENYPSNSSFKLFPNFPNPFNPTTTISYQLSFAAGGHVTLKVYDVLGREVATLVNQVQKAGRHQVRFDGSRLASGVYFYRIYADHYFNSEKMMLLK